MELNLKTKDAQDYLNEVQEYLDSQAAKAKVIFDHLEHISGCVYRMVYTNGATYGIYVSTTTEGEVIFIPDNAIVRSTDHINRLMFGKIISYFLHNCKGKKFEIMSFIFKPSPELSEADKQLEISNVLLGLGNILRADQVTMMVPDKYPNAVRFINFGEKGNSHPHEEYYKYREPPYPLYSEEGRC